ncbi:MAG: RecX family transcriptional regulator [Clostridia bacterium]|nr:RecX family transcriptional regulator [Clostridia bacterium]
MKQKLHQKGISDDFIQFALNEQKDSGELEKISQISAKYLKNKDKTPENMQKLTRYLAGKGFKFDDINQYLGGYDDESWD